MTARTSPPRSASERGFALVLTVLLTLVVGFGIAVSLRRQGAQTLAVERQLRAYQEHHGQMGLQDAIRVWLGEQRSQSLPDALGERGHALDLVLTDGSIVSVYLADGQARALGVLTGVTGRSLDDATRVLEALQTLAGARGLDAYTRGAGPVAISIATAPRAVVRAAFRAALGEDGDRSADELLRLRDAGEVIDRATLNGITSANTRNAEGRSMLNRLLAYDPTLWTVLVEIRQRAGGRLTARYGGLVQISSNRGRQASAMGSGGNTFLTWRNLGVGPDAEIWDGDLETE